MAALVLLTFAALTCADQVRVRYNEGLTRGFMALRTEDGQKIAEGESSQIVKNGVVTAHQVFHFDDGSLYDDVTTFTQRGTFHLLTDHMIQKGPAFPTQMESWLDTRSGQVTARTTKNGKTESASQKISLPPDLANGILFTIVKSLLWTPQTTVSYLAFDPKPKLVKLMYTREGTETLHADGAAHEAVRFLMKVDIGGVTGAVVKITGKQPADTHIWVITGEAPTYAGSEGPLYGEGPVWKIELVSPRRGNQSQSQSR